MNGCFEWKSPSSQDQAQAEESSLWKNTLTTSTVYKSISKGRHGYGGNEPSMAVYCRMDSGLRDHEQKFEASDMPSQHDLIYVVSFRRHIMATRPSIGLAAECHLLGKPGLQGWSRAFVGLDLALCTCVGSMFVSRYKDLGKTLTFVRRKD